MSGETAFALEAPDRLRIDGLSDFGIYQSQMAFDRGTVRILWPGEGRYYEGAATSENLGRYLLVGLPPQTIVDILLGRCPLPGGDLQVFETGKAGRCVVKGGGLEAVVVREGESGDYVPDQYTVSDDEGRPAYRVAFEKYEREDGSIWFVDRMTARFWEVAPSRTKARIEVQYREIEINPVLDKGVFQIRVPREARRVED